MREGWKIEKLGSLASYVNGYPFKPTDWAVEGLPIIRIQNLNSARDEYHYFNGSILPRYKVCKGDILISWSASLGVFTWNGPDALLNQHIFKVVFDKEEIIKEFFVYAVSYKLDEMKKLVHGATMQHITRGKFDGIDIPIPPLPEQQRIVDILDREFAKIDALKANAEKSLQAAKDLFFRMLAHTFSNPSWSWKRIGDVFDTGAGGTPLKTYKEYYENGDIPWLRSGEVCKKYITETEMFITQLGMDNSSAKMFPKNSVVVAMYGATAGQVGILHLETTTNQAVCCILPKEDYVPEFIYYSLLNSKKGLVAQATGNAQPNISQIKIKNTTIPLISKDEQVAVVSRLDNLNDRCNTLQENYQKTLTLCDDLKQSLLRKAFIGEL